MPKRFAAVAVLALLSACGRGAGQSDEAVDERPGAAGYLTPPAPTDFAGGVLSGVGTPRARIRLASPTGEAQFAEVGADGRWSLRPPTAAEPRIYGLSMTADGRQVQSQGYVLISSRGGQAALLRAGGGSRRLDRQSGALGAFDFDRGGGAVLSGSAPADAVVLVRLDGRQVSEGRADASGRFTVALPPIGSGGHRLEVQGDGFADTATVETRPAEPLVGGPLRSQFSGAGLRADWLTPGGGVQTTVLID